MWPTAVRGDCDNNDLENGEDYDDDDSIDPRVQDELERLNNATDVINKLEVELDEARAAFRQLLSDSTQRINLLGKKLGACVERARPYYDARIIEKKAHMETQKAALRFERATSAHMAAKEMMFLAEEGLKKEGRTFDLVWQEMLNHATMKVNEAESERTFSEQEHQRISKAYNEAEKSVQGLKKDLKRSIIKSSLSARRNLLQIIDLAHQHQLLLLPYFEMKVQFNRLMEDQKKRVQELEENVLKAKQNYADALFNLEEISDEIHKRRTHRQERLVLGTRGSGVGAEHPEPLTRLGGDHVTAQDASSQKNSSSISGSSNSNEYPKFSKPLPKSHSYGQLSGDRMLASKSTGFVRPVSNVRLMKSQSVVDRTEIGPLFGRYSISKHHKLQVDHGSQTEENLLYESTTHSSPTTSTSKADKAVDIGRLPAPAVVVAAAAAGSSNSSSTRTSPDGPTTFVGRNVLGASAFDESEASDSESLASIECLTDEQIASLVLDKELEDVIERFSKKASLVGGCSGGELDDDAFEDTRFSLYGLSTTTQTTDESEDELTVVEAEAPPTPTPTSKQQILKNK